MVVLEINRHLKALTPLLHVLNAWTKSRFKKSSSTKTTLTNSDTLVSFMLLFQSVSRDIAVTS